MRYFDFRQSFSQPIFTTQDIRLFAKNITPSQLTMWQKQQFITKIRGGVYIFNDQKKQISAWELAAVAVEPSYISLETVLAKHSLIPEMVFSTTSITTKNFREYRTDYGLLSYRHVKADLFFGYYSEKGSFRPYNIAYPEKALLDFFYLFPQYRDQDDIEGLRIEPSVFRELNQGRLRRYLTLFPPRVRAIIQVIRSMHD